MAETSTHTNIEAILRLEEEAERGRSLAERASENIGRFVGTLSFVFVQVVLAAGWVSINLGPRAIDPFPFVFLAGVLAFESVILTAFVLMRQNRLGRRADRRNHLDLQINLLAEQEATKIIQMLERMSRQLGIEDKVADPVSRELAADTSIDEIAKDITEGIDGDTDKKP